MGEGFGFVAETGEWNRQDEFSVWRNYLDGNGGGALHDSTREYFHLVHQTGFIASGIVSHIAERAPLYQSYTRCGYSGGGRRIVTIQDGNLIKVSPTLFSRFRKSRLFSSPMKEPGCYLSSKYYILAINRIRC